MSDFCNICNTPRPEGGTNTLVLNHPDHGQQWLEFCKDCEGESLTNSGSGATTTIGELFRKGQAPSLSDELRKEVEREEANLEAERMERPDDYNVWEEEQIFQDHEGDYL